MGFTTDPKDKRLGRGVDKEPVPQNEVYLVLSDEERAKGFVRPYRESYKHVGPPGPKYPLRDLTDAEKAMYEGSSYAYVKYEDYPKNEDGSPADGSSALGRFWTQEQLDAVGKGCGEVITMARPLAETYAREPGFYGATYCCYCHRHLPVAEFVWVGTNDRVGS